jgi:DNA-binding MarR family transcriptional regulator
MVEKRAVSERALAELIEQLGRCAYGDAFTDGLNPAQWTALRYFGRANRFSRTVSAFALYHGTTRGTASQTVKALVEKRYLRRRPVKTDQRSFRLELTAKARKFLAQDPFDDLVSAAEVLSAERRTFVVDGLQAILGRLVKHRGGPLFGVCPSCAHLRGEGCCLQSGSPYECGLFGEPLSEEELAEICVNYEPAA